MVISGLSSIIRFLEAKAGFFLDDLEDAREGAYRLFRQWRAAESAWRSTGDGCGELRVQSCFRRVRWRHRLWRRPCRSRQHLKTSHCRQHPRAGSWSARRLRVLPSFTDGNPPTMQLKGKAEDEDKDQREGTTLFQATGQMKSKREERAGDCPCVPSRLPAACFWNTCTGKRLGNEIDQSSRAPDCRLREGGTVLVELQVILSSNTIDPRTSCAIRYRRSR